MPDSILHRAPAAVIAAMVTAILVEVLLIPFANSLAGYPVENLSGNQMVVYNLVPAVLILVPVVTLALASTSPLE